MQLFDLLNPRLFKPLAGQKQKFFAELLMLLWGKCKRSKDYSMERSALMAMAEEYFSGLAVELTLGEPAEGEAEASATMEAHAQALWFLGQLRDTGWLEDLDSGYGEEVRTAVSPLVVPLIQAMEGILFPRTVTYSGKLFKAYQLLKNIRDEPNPYENVLREISADMGMLNDSLRQLNASIGTYLDRLTRNRTPQEVLELFDQYEEKVVVSAYHRFKTSDNLFNYRASIQDGLDECEEAYFEALAADYGKVEQADEAESAAQVRLSVQKLRDDLDEMSELIREIDKNHILYRKRAVQRAQFLLLSDSSTQGKINDLLRYYAAFITTAPDLDAVDDSPLSRNWKLFPTGAFGERFLKPPVTSRKPTPIEPLQAEAPLTEEELRREQAALLAYARTAVTQENVNRFAKNALEGRQGIRASALALACPEEFVKIIGLHTYSRSTSRDYEIEPEDRWVTCGGVRFNDFVLRKKG